MWWVEYEKNLQLVLLFLSNERDELLELRARVHASETATSAERQTLQRDFLSKPESALH